MHVEAKAAELDRSLTTVFAHWHIPRDSVVAPFAQVWDFVEMNFEPLLALLGGSARSAWIGRLRCGHQGRGFDDPSSRARPPLPGEVRSAHRPGPPAPSRAQNRVRHTCMRGARGPCMHASHPHRPAPPLQPQMPPQPHFLALCGAPQSTPQTPTDFCAAHGAPLSAAHELGLCRGLRVTNELMVQSNKGLLFFLFVGFQMADVPRGGRRHEPRGPRAARTSIFFVLLRQ